MNYADKEKLSSLRRTFDLNYKLTNVYATYLNHFPELITKEMIDELTSDGKITKEDAICAIISEAFGLDDSKGGEDRILIRNYIRPSIRLLDTKKYTENEYYKNVKIPSVKDGNWEFKEESYPAYRAVICDDMVIKEDFSEFAPIGFFTEEFTFPAVLEDGNEWMTLTPVDIDTCERAIFEANGNVITFGLGLGYYAYAVSRKQNVKSVTVIEKSPDVIRLFEKYILPYFKNKEKITVICDDAFAYAENEMPKKQYDYAFVDTWRDASDGAPMYMIMKSLEKLNPKTKFSYWIENFLISRIRALDFENLFDDVTSSKSSAPQTYDEFKERLILWERYTNLNPKSL